MDLMTIGAFAGRSRLSPKALRLYDRLGLLPPARTDPVSGYRFYSEDQVAGARLVGLLRRLGMPLPAIADIAGRPPGEAAEAIAGYWQDVGLDAKVVPMDFSAFRKLWFDRSSPGALVCYNQANRNAFGAYSALTKFGFFDKPTPPTWKAIETSNATS